MATQAASGTARRTATPWGDTEVVEELRLRQRAGHRRFESVIQLLELPDGERLVRFAYATEGVVRRGPVTLRAADLRRLREGLATRPALAAALPWGGDATATG
jgi:hypothetical protein